MRFRILVTDGDADWWEDCECDDRKETPHQWTKRILKEFNATLGDEKPRRLLSLRILLAADKKHKWRKTNLVTIQDGNRMYDAYECEVCGLKGKRHGFGAVIPSRVKECVPK